MYSAWKLLNHHDAYTAFNSYHISLFNRDEAFLTHSLEWYIML